MRFRFMTLMDALYCIYNIKYIKPQPETDRQKKFNHIYMFSWYTEYHNWNLNDALCIRKLKFLENVIQFKLYRTISVGKLNGLQNCNYKLYRQKSVWHLNWNEKIQIRDNEIITAKSHTVKLYMGMTS